MKEGFDHGARVRTAKGPFYYGELVTGPMPKPEGWKFPHYDGDGWYFVKWEGREEVFVAREDDLELAPEPHPSLYKTTIVIWSDFNPDAEGMGIERLAREATSGEAYCSKQRMDLVQDPSRDPDWDGTEFFGEPGEGAPPYDAATATGMYDREDG